jgi:hypothetical protein
MGKVVSSDFHREISPLTQHLEPRTFRENFGEDEEFDEY